MPEMADTEEMVSLDDIEAVREMYANIQNHRDRIVVNRNQCRNACARMTSALATLLRMPSPRPSPELITCLRSLDDLVTCLCDETESRKFLFLHFTGQNVFHAFRQRFARAWSLLPTSQWATEDAHALALDEIENLSMITELASASRAPARFMSAESNKEVKGALRRKGTHSGWKLQVQEIENGDQLVPMPLILRRDASADVCGRLRDGFTTCAADLEGPSPMIAEHRICLFEKAPAYQTNDDLESFIIDCSHRFCWWHPSLSRFVGAYTEAIDASGEAFITLGYAEEDHLAQGFSRLDHTIFDLGSRCSLHSAITICVKVADAMHYVRVNAQESAEVALNAWSWAPPANVFVRSAGADRPSSKLDHLIGSSSLEVRFTPPFVHSRTTSRWVPPSRAVCSEAYAVGLLLLACLTNAAPLHGIDDRDLLKASIEACVTPIAIPNTLPYALQVFCAKCLAVGDEAGFASLKRCRTELLALHDLGKDFPAPPPGSNVPSVIVGDLGR